MKNSSLIVCGAFLKKQPPQKREALTSYLFEAERQELAALPSTLGDPTEDLPPISDRLAQFHPSWFASFLRTLSEKDIRLFLSCLHESQASQVQKILLFTGSRISLTKIATAYLQQILWRRITGDQPDLLPTSFLPQSSLSVLLDLEGEELLWLVDFLGLHDVSVEVRQIIDTTRLKAIYSVLSENEQNYLKMLLQSKEPVVFSRIGLSSWSGTPDDLRNLIRQRGLSRLGKSIYGQDPSFIWHVMHRMDADIALVLQRFCTPLDNLTAAKMLVSQVLELVAYLRQAA